ncbi:MAG: 23S rRNA (adenine(2503)-C(2))-methyltransferase RlmN [Planctomycetota bacterium]|nr:23S rRNA (adenine(2503)-C(2))-methyltransferase RlmN [Planctomycetota bacterium]
MPEPTALHGFPLSDLQRLFARHGVPAHQARLAFQALHRHGILEPERMPAISDKCRKFLRSWPPLPRLSLDAVHRAQDGTTKLRLKTLDGHMLEAVVIPANRRTTLCVSSQIGCAAGCAFCHTGTMGLTRNLDAWEIIEQYRIANEILAAPGQSQVANQKSRITNVVFMGMGEPLHNLASVVQACRVLNEDLGAGLSRRHIVVSTAGVGDRICSFWEQGVASLAVSLHATTDELRGQLAPLSRRWNLAALREILLSIPWRNRESVTVAYLLLDGLNGTRDDARRLAEWLKGLPAKLNLLEFNPYPGCRFRRTSPEKLAAFRQWLYEFGVFNTLRHSRGGDVLAACGQLAGRAPSR